MRRFPSPPVLVCGLALEADLSGTKYSKSGKLDPPSA